MAIKRCIKCSRPAAKMVDGKLYCERCLLIADKNKEMKQPCNCGCKMIVEEKPKKKSFWRRLFDHGYTDHM